MAPKKTKVYKNWTWKESRASLSGFEDSLKHFKLQLCEEFDDLTLDQYVADA